ncbi:protein ROOT HAIR SPECIFIC 17 [Pyrus x bretschneideri]|uniref:protein ROOT HAIR SPECIFIC 17 n=1 Tax=Pyrus x bretschneideri TaxID=225117 RepID=UPI00202E0080|nr:protein ROOT HAIR SPECIFIC 17 [Pyrus x bretschneideri]
MKKKKRDAINGHSCINITATAIGGVVFKTSVLRRHFRRIRHHVFPLISAVSGCLLLFLAAFSVLAPSPVLHPHDHLSLLRHLTSDDNGDVEVWPNSEETTKFRVPESGGSSGRYLWSTRKSELFYGCSNAADNFATADAKTHSNRYLLIATSGGLNQQRTGITDAVVAAYILNATLVVPKLDQKSYWKDSSNFDEIFDVDWFISSLSKDVKIIKELPMKGGKPMSVHTTRVPRKCNEKCYQNRLVPVLNKKHAVQLTKFDYRLSNRLNSDLQKLRCRANYQALKFINTISEMGKKLVERMRMKSKHFIALHLRFEPDMLAFSGCDYGGGEKERKELGKLRKRWKTLHASNPDKVRRHGRCPLTPEEVGLMLRALGFGNDIHLYVASGEVYGGEETMAPLKILFPNFHTKETLLSKEELAPFSSFSSRMAALDFIVCDESDVFITNNNGNMAKMLAGRRRYFGHKPTIRPNAKKLSPLFINRNNMTWEEFASRLRTSQIGFMGEPNEIKPGRGEFHENPVACICSASNTKAKEVPILQNESPDILKIDKEDYTNKDSGYATDEQVTEDEQDWSEADYDEITNRSLGKVLPSVRVSDPSLLHKSDQPEIEEFFSD